jgi:CDP-diacylglycerol---glycerol-3-phosphate 3-phosphatidyltransferase
MLARWLRTWDRRILKPLLAVMAHSGVQPDVLTMAGLVTVVVAGLALSQGYLIPGACILLLGGLLDATDGELARFTDRETRLGGFLDSISDHCGDFAVYLGLLWLSLTGHRQSDVLLIFAALFGSVFGSQVRSRAMMAGIDVKDIGLFTRCERLLVLALGLFTDRVTEALWALALFNNLSAAQRLLHVVQNLRRAP